MPSSTTVQLTAGPGVYTSLGVGPMKVHVKLGAPVQIITASTQPATSALGIEIPPGGALDFVTTDQIWASTTVSQATIVSLPLQTGGGGGGGDATAANQVLIINAIGQALPPNDPSVIIGSTRGTAIIDSHDDGWDRTKGTTNDLTWPRTGPMTTNAGLRALIEATDTPPPVRGAVTTASPTYTPGAPAALSLNTSGGLRVDGTGATQPISAASLPLPAGAATAAKQPAIGTAGAASADVITIQGKSGMTAVATDGSAVTQPVSAASLPLPTGAATAANQPSNNAQNAAIAGVTGPLMMLEAVAAPATFGATTVNPALANIAGHARVANGTSAISVTGAVTSNGAYSAGNCLGTLMAFTITPDMSELKSLTVCSRSIINSSLKAYLFYSAPGGTFTDKTTPVLTSSTDSQLILKVVPLNNPDSGLGTHTIWESDPLNVCITSATVRILLVTVSAITLTGGSVNEITCRITYKH